MVNQVSDQIEPGIVVITWAGSW